MATSASGKWVVLGIVATSAALAALVMLRGPTIQIRPQTPSDERPSLAVLPFENLTVEDELELLTSDITIAVTEALGGHPELALIPRELALAYKGVRGGVQEAAEELDADFVLAGSLAREDETLEVAVYFVDVDVESRIWAERFAFPAAERASIPDAVAANVKRALEKP